MFPWKENTNMVFEDCWVMTEHDKVTIDGDEMEVKEFNLNLKGI